MRYLEESKIFFIHVPKCAGISVKRALDDISRLPDAELGLDLGIGTDTVRQFASWHGYHHSSLGRIHLGHIPLRFLELYFPNTWDVFLNSVSFAVVREPRARFISALMQRLQEFKQSGSIRLEDELVQQEARQVCEWLDQRREDFCDIEYIHFTRQIDYTHLSGKQLVGNVFPLERMDAMAAWFARDHGITIDVLREHTRQQPRKWVSGIMPAVRFLARNGLPRSVREAAYPLWSASFLAPAASQYEKVTFTPAIEGFIARHYADDAALHRRVLEQFETLEGRVPGNGVARR